jgi:hypothetical protein
VLADYYTEGPETLTITLSPIDSFGTATGSLSADVTLNDTSKTPAYSNVSFDVPSIDENNTDVATFTVNTENVLDGTTVDYTITGTTVDQISLGSLTGTLTINSDTASFGFTAIEDNFTDGNSTVTVTLDSIDSFGTATGNLFANVDIIDTSLTPIIPPTASDVYVSMNRGVTTVVQLAGSINDVDGNIVSISTVSGPSNGNASVTFISESNVFYTYTPDPTFAGNDLIEYFVTDNVGETSNTANIFLTVRTAPTAVDDFVTLDENTSILVNVVNNDIAGDFAIDFSTLTIVAGPTYGNATAFSNGTISYTPDIGYSGNDIVSYTIEDVAGGVSLPGDVNFTIDPNIIVPNTPPNTEDDFAYVSINNTVLINVLENDSDNENGIDVTSVTIASSPANGNVIAFANGIVSYTPSLDFSGVDTFTYNIRDVVGAISNNATVTVEVLTSPIAVDDNVTIQRNTVAEIFVPGNDFDPDGNLDLTSVVIISEPTDGTAVLDQLSGNITYTPNFNFFGTDTFQYTIEDDTGLISGPGTVTITVEFGASAKPPFKAFNRSEILVGQPVNKPVRVYGEILNKFAPELLSRVTNRSQVPMQYFYDNPKIAYSTTKTPELKFIGYNPSSYPSTAVEDRIPIKWSDFVGYAWYFIEFPDPSISITNFAGLTAYTNNGTAQVSASYSIEYFEDGWPVPPRPEPTKRRVTIQWYKAEPNQTPFVSWGQPIVVTSGQGISSGVTTSPSFDLDGANPQDVGILLSVKAELIGPNDDDPLNIVNTDKVYAANEGNAIRVLEIKPFEVGSAPLVNMATLDNETVRIDITRRSNDLAIVNYSADPVRFRGNGAGASYTYPPAPGRSPVNTNYFVWEIQNPETGAWSDLAFGGINGLSWPQSLPYDGLDGNPNYSGWAVRLKAQGQQNLSDPTEQNYSDIFTTADSTVADNGGYLQTSLNFVTSYLTIEYTAQVLYPCLKGINLAGRFLIKNAPATANYYWRIVPDGAHANEFSPTSGTLFNVAPGGVDELVIAGINPTCAIGEIVDLPYILEVYADAGYTELLDSTNFSTKYGVPSLQFDTIARVDRNGNAVTPRGIATGQTFDTREGSQAVLRVVGQNLQKDEFDNFYISYNRTVADTTTATDLQYRLPDQASWTTVAPGTRFPVDITSAGVGFESDQYELNAIVFLRFIDDSPGGGERDNFEQFNLKLFENSSGGAQEDNFNLKVYDNYEYFLGIVDSLEVQNPKFKTVNGELSQTGSGYIKWTGATLGQSYGTFLGFSVYDTDTWGSAISNPGPEYENSNFGGLYQWQYWTGSGWAQLGDVYNPSGGAERNLNGDARCVQREDDYFEFKNINSTTIGGINWANGVSVRCRYQSFYNFSSISSPGVLIETKFSNSVTLKIEVEDETQTNGLTAIWAYGLDEQPSENHIYSVFSEGVTGNLVDISVTNNHLYMAGITGYPTTELTDVRLDGNRTDINNGRLLPLGRPVFAYYHDESVKETVTATLQDPSSVAGDGETTVSRDFVIKNAPWELARVWAQSSSNTVTTRTWQLDEGESVRIGVELKNWPSEFNSAFGGGQFFIYDAYIGGTAIPDSEMDTYFSGLSTITSLTNGNPYTNTYYSTKQGGNFALTGQGSSGSVAGRQNYRYVGNFNIQTILQSGTSDDITFKVLAYGRTTGESTEALSLSTAFPLGIGNGYMWTVEFDVTVKNTIPAPWEPSTGDISHVGTENWYEDGLNNSGEIQNPTVPYHGQRWPTCKLSDGTLSAPVGTPAYYRLRADLSTAVEGVDFIDVNTNTFEVRSTGAIHQTLPGLRPDGGDKLGVLYELVDDGIAVEDDDKTIVWEMSFFSDFSIGFTGSMTILDRYDPPQVPPVASAVPSAVFANYIYGRILDGVDYSNKYARARLIMSFNGGVYTATNSFNTGLEQQAVFRGNWLPDGQVNSDYEVMFEFIDITSDNAPNLAPTYLKYVTGSAMDTWHSLNATKSIGLEADPPTQLRNIEAALTINVKLKHVDAPVSDAVSKVIVLSIAQEP